MLTACHGSARLEPDAANPVIQTRTVLTTVCPPDLANAPAVRPRPAAEAVIRYNGPGGEHLAALIAWGETLFDTLVDARADCARSGSVAP